MTRISAGYRQWPQTDITGSPAGESRAAAMCRYRRRRPGVTGCMVIGYVVLILAAQGFAMGQHAVGNPPDLTGVKAAKWNHLAGRGIFFGHQSVGGNIMEGVEDLVASEPMVRLKPVVVETPEEITRGGFAHARVGKNRTPQSKMSEFARFVRNAADQIDIAFLKLCYVDITRKTDVKALFETYRATMDQLRQQFPQVTFVHLTVPLRVRTDTWRTSIKTLLGRPAWEHADNVRRNEYNHLLTTHYKDREPVFDVALYEAMAGDGSLDTFKEQGSRYLALQPGYSYDGGHLNEAGRRWVAGHLLVFLADLP